MRRKRLLYASKARFIKERSRASKQVVRIEIRCFPVFQLCIRNSEQPFLQQHCVSDAECSIRVDITHYCLRCPFGNRFHSRRPCRLYFSLFQRNTGNRECAGDHQGCGEVHREVNLYQEQPLAGGCFIIHIRFADKEKSILLESILSSLLCAVKNLRPQADCSKSLSGVFHDHGFNSIRYILAGIGALFKR